MQTNWQRISRGLDAEGWLTNPTEMAPYLKEWRGHYQGQAAAVARPSNTAEVSALVAACAEQQVSIVPQGGNTGLVGGACPMNAEREIVLSLERLNRIETVDIENNTMTVGAGCRLADVQEAAAAAERYFPLRLIPHQQCQIGGNIASNAGGTNVLKYGNTRSLVLGLEVVLADGQIWNGLSGLRKDNAGYDLKQLFIGSEGTLGIITRAVLKLFPAIHSSTTLLTAHQDLSSCIALLRELQAASGDDVSACELMSRTSLELALKHDDATAEPFSERYPWYLLTELSSASQFNDLQTAAEQTLAKQQDLPAYRLARSATEAEAIWALRKAIPAAQSAEGGSIKHDISVPLSSMAAFVAQATTACEAAMPGIRVCPFGHLGDGNLHFNLSQGLGVDKNSFLERRVEFNQLIHSLVVEHQGSIAAEHGIGQLKQAALQEWRDATSVASMQRLKQALDPAKLFSPGKVLK